MSSLTPADKLALFPTCRREDCPERGTTHADIWPNQEKLVLSRAKYIASIGGYRAGKSLAAAARGHLLSLAVPGNIGLILRQSYRLLHDSTLRYFMHVIERSGTDCEFRENRDGFPHRIIYPNESEVHIRESSDPDKFLGTEYGWFWMDEARLEPEQLFTALMSRLSLPHARARLCGMLTSNPPDDTHWIVQHFGSVEGYQIKTTVVRGKPVQTRYELIVAPTRENLALDDAYEADIRATHTEAEVQRILEGQFGFEHVGTAVYTPPFDPRRHVGIPEPARDRDGLPYPITRAWDFGFLTPAVLWSSFSRCRLGQPHWAVLDEFVGAKLEAEDLGHEVLRRSRDRFPNIPMEDLGDKAGAFVSDKGPGAIIRLARPPWNLKFRYRNIPNIDPGLALVREVLNDKCGCGEERFLVHRRCQSLIKTLAGGYHYSRQKPGREIAPKPVKDGFYDNLADCLRYTGELGYRVHKLDPKAMDALMAYTRPQAAWQPVTDSTGRWMEGRPIVPRPEARRA